MAVRLTACAVGAVLGFAWSLPAQSQVKPETLVKQRQAAMVLQSKYFDRHLRPTAQGKIPYDAKLVARNVSYLEALARMPWDGFAPGTRSVKSRAAPAVFDEPARFKEAQDSFQAEVTRLSEVTRKGDEAAVRAQILAVHKSCSSCHDTFRESR